eukprot:XP_001699700.1 predicted protein [Chlamydomonas reinhardtii]
MTGFRFYYMRFVLGISGPAMRGWHNVFQSCKLVGSCGDPERFPWRRGGRPELAPDKQMEWASQCA